MNDFGELSENLQRIVGIVEEWIEMSEGRQGVRRKFIIQTILNIKGDRENLGQFSQNSINIGKIYKQALKLQEEDEEES